MDRVVSGQSSSRFQLASRGTTINFGRGFASTSPKTTATMATKWPMETERPYLGLSAFSPEDADNYFGREQEVNACVNRLRVDSLLAVVGPSGAGKSSFVQAGIIPSLPRHWRAITVRPGPRPLDQLIACLRREGIAGVDELPELLREDSLALWHLLCEHATQSGQLLLLVVDQFEELLTLCLDGDERRLYAEALMRAARHSYDPVRIIITLRDDFLVRTQQLAALRDRLTQSLQLLGTPPPDELERILIEPAKRAGFSFEDAELPRKMVAEVADEPGALALLSFTASKLWESRNRQLRLLPRRAYEALGGVGGALAQHAEETLEDMPTENQPPSARGVPPARDRRRHSSDLDSRRAQPDSRLG